MSELSIRLSDLSKIKGIGPKTIERVREFLLAENGYISKYDSELHLEPNSLNLGDCLKLMNGIPDNSIDMVLADLPYGSTQCSWDTVIPIDTLWGAYLRIIKEGGAIVLTATEPFASHIRMSGINLYKHEWIWDKKNAGNFIQAKSHPMRVQESILVFSRDTVNYFPIMEKANPKNNRPLVTPKQNTSLFGRVGSGRFKEREDRNRNQRYPQNIIEFNSRGAECNNANRIHPTQKPVKLFEYLIRTYTKEGDTVLDNTAGVYTTAIAAINTNRHYICIEKDPNYHTRGSRWVELVQSGVGYTEAIKTVRREMS